MGTEKNKRDEGHKSKKRIFLLIMIGLLINLIGRRVAFVTHAPFWLDAIGTCMCAMSLGPIGGGICGILSVFSLNIFYPGSIAYILTSTAIGITVGICSKKGFFKELFGILSASVIIGFITVILSTPINIIMRDGRCGNIWGDGMFDMLIDGQNSKILASVIADAFIDIPDKILSLFILLGIAKLYHKWKQSDKKMSAGKKQHKNQNGAALIMLSFLLGTAIFQSKTISVQAAEINQNDYVEIIYNSENKMTSSEANDIVQTPDGYIWAGSYAGLYRYDGSQFQMVGWEDNITSVTSLFVDSKGRLIIGTNDSGLAIYEDGKFKLYNIQSGLAANSIRSVSEGENGELFIGTTGLLSVLNADGTIDILDDLPQITYVNNLTNEKNGIIGGVTNDGILFFLKDRKIIFSEQAKNNSDEYYTCIYQMSESKYIVGMSQNHLEFFTKINDNMKSSGKIYMSGLASVRSMTQDKEGHIWICADNGMGYLDQTGNFKLVSIADFNNSVESMIQDYEGNYWFASSRMGVLELTKNIFTDVFKNVNITHDVVNATCLHNGLLYSATDNGLIIINEKDSKMIFDDLTKKMKAVRIRSLLEDSKGNLWLATYGTDGLVCLTAEGDILSYNESKNGTQGSRFRSVLELKDGTIVAASSTGLSFIDNGNVTTVIGEEDGLTNPQILCLYEMQDGTILAGSDGDGLFLIRDRKVVKNITFEDGLPSQIILRIQPFHNGYLLVTSNSLCYMDKKCSIRKIDNFPYSNNLDVKVLGDGNVWVLSSAGIFIVHGEDLYLDKENLSYRLLGTKQGLGTSLTANSWNCMDQDGWLYLSCASGVRKIKTSDCQSYTGDYKLAINNISTENGVIRPNQKGIYEIPRTDNRVIIDPALLDYTLNDPYIRYWMDGFDLTPITIRLSELNQIMYSKLPSGTYCFHFEILDENTLKPIKKMQINLDKERKFYEHSWFYAYVIFIILFLVTFITWALTRISNMSLIKNQYDQIRTAKDEAENANNAKSMFLANMSHEIRTPMNAVVGMSEIALKEDIPDNVREDLNNILSASKKLLGIINDILDFSKIESGKMELVNAEYSLSELLHDVVNIINFRLEDKPVELLLEVDEDILDCMIGDELRVRQILINLLNNSVKFTDQGSITLSIKEINEDGFKLLIDVKDTGCGIRPEDMDRLFESFERVENTVLHSVEGTGLGLSICKNMLSLMGGTITVESEIGKGSTFHIVLPQQLADDKTTMKEAREKKENKKDDTPNPQEKVIFPSARILIVDDNELNLKVANGLMKEYQMQIETVQSGVKCLEMTSKKVYDLILLDHVMPQMDGIETLHELQERVDFHTPVVALTANAMNGVRKLYAQEGFADYLGKPMEQPEILRVLKRLLSDKMRLWQQGQVTDQMKTGHRTKKNQKQVEQTINVSGHRDEKAIEKITEKATDKKNDKVESDLLLALKEEGLNIEAAMRFMGNSEEQYVEILQLFVTGAEERQKELQSYYDSENWSEYGILVHALKSNARSIGADSLADISYELEKAAKAGNASIINENHEKLFFEWNLLLTGLRFIPRLGFISEMLTKMKHNQVNTDKDHLKEDTLESEKHENGVLRNGVLSNGMQDSDVSRSDNLNLNTDQAIDKELESDFTDKEFTDLKEQLALLLDDFEIEDVKEKFQQIKNNKLNKLQKECMEIAEKAVHEYDYEKAVAILRA